MIPRPALRSWVTAHVSREETVRAVAFVVRCTGAAVLALSIADRLHLDHPVWASVSALVVSQDRLGDTHRSLGWRIVGTLIGVAVAVGVTAAIARIRTDLRVCMWTSVIVLLTVPPGGTILTAALARSQEVLLGVAIGAILHWGFDRLLFHRTG